MFSVTENPLNKAGSIWWFNEPAKYINYPDIPLSDRVDEAVLSILRRRISVRLDDIIAELFKMYPNGLTPDPRKISATLEKYAFQSSGKWKLKDSVSIEVTKHTEVIGQLCKMAKKMGYFTFVGRREQPEYLANDQQLRDIADIDDLSFLLNQYDHMKLERISMIDCIFVQNNSIDVVFEVENSTNFSSAIIRASNIQNSIPKLMVIPDSREAELLAFSDPLFKEAFKAGNWKYITYTSIGRLSSLRTLTIDEILQNAKGVE